MVLSKKVQSKCISLTKTEVKILDNLKKYDITHSMADGVRFCILYTWEKLQKIMENQERIISRFQLSKGHRNTNYNPEIIYVKNGRKYDKYQKIKDV